jgi:hypothetical protein
MLACAVIALLAAVAVPGTATATLSIPAYEITSDLPTTPPGTTVVPTPGPSTLISGAHPDAGSYTVFNYTTPGEDLHTALTNFGPGLLGNPESVPKCPQAALEAGGAGCPAGSQIGTSRLDVAIAGTNAPLTGFAGTLYNAELLGSEPGRLAAVTHVGPTTLVSSIPFNITPRANGDYGLTGTLTDIATLDAPPPDFQVYALSFLINGSQNNYVRNPTSCEINVSTGQAATYEDPTFVDGPAYTFPTSGCQNLPFAPKVSVTVGDRGSTAFNKFPPMTVKITQINGEADEMGNKITLPIELNTNNTAYTLCSQAQADSNTCPAASKFGWATAHSPFLSEAVQGPVYLIQQTSTSLPGLLLDLNGRAHVKVQTKTSLINGKQIQSLILNAPQLPVSDITVALNGGRKTGVFLNREDLCFKGDSTTKFNSVTGVAKFYGWNGKQTGDDKFTAAVNGCGPAVASKLKAATTSRPALTVTATKHPNAPNMKELTVTLSDNLSVVKSKLGSGGSASASATSAKLSYVSKHKFKVTGLPTAGASAVKVLLRKGAVRVSSKSRSTLKRGKSKSFSAKVTPTPVSGQGTSTKTKFKVKGPKKK